jgi:hypothetical protein
VIVVMTTHFATQAPRWVPPMAVLASRKVLATAGVESMLTADGGGYGQGHGHAALPYWPPDLFSLARLIYL